MKSKKVSKVVLSFLLSIALMIEPAAAMPVVYAEETSSSEQGQTVQDSTLDDLNNDAQKQDENLSEEGKDGATEEESDETGDGTEDKTGDGTEDKTGDGTEDKTGDETEDKTGEESEDKTGEETGDKGDEETDEPTEKDEQDQAGEEVSVSENELDEEREETKEDADIFSDMPSSYQLNASQRELKKSLSNVFKNLDESEEGGTYASRQVYTFADSRETAEMIAEAYHAEIISFDMGVLTLKLSGGTSVKQAVMAAADMDNSLPPVWPDYKNELHEEILPQAEDAVSEMEVIEEEYVIEGGVPEAGADDGEIPSQASYEQVLNELDGFSDSYLQPTSDKYQWFHTAIGSPYAWDAGYQGDGIKVGVVDSGVNSNTDLSANVVNNKDFCDDTNAAADSDGHGTHVAGIIAALANGNNGVGVAPKAKIYNAKVFGTNVNKSGYDSTIMAAILYLIGEENNAADLTHIGSDPAKVDIINMSLGGYGKNIDWDENGKLYSPFQLIVNKAYQKGVTVFVSTGNEGGSLAMYPAAYDHVIGVAATDTNNQRASFSNYGIAADLAAPGVDIYSTSNTGNGYVSMQGTSMACPVAAGEAAVILSGQDALPQLKGKSGAAKVDALTKIMQSNTISAGSGMGKGITSLPKVFKLSTAAEKPKAPEITAAVAENKQSVTVTIKAQAGMKLCYTTNGKNPSYKNEQTDANTTLVNSNIKTLTLDCTQNAGSTVKAFAINASGVIGPVKSYKYTLAPYVTGIVISGPGKVEVGKSVQLSAEITPKYAKNKKLAWELTKVGGTKPEANVIKIDPAKGKITVGKNIKDDELGQYQVTATADDAGKKSAQFTFELVKAGTAIQSMSFDKKANKELWLTKTGAESRSLISDLTVKAKDANGQTTAVEGNALQGRLVWSSNKPAVVEVDQTGKITAKAAGTATITAKANDSGNKKATISITVKQAVTDITITSDNGDTGDTFYAAVGKAITLKAVVTPKKPASSKVKWTISPKDPNVSISTSGKITVKAGAAAQVYTVTAEAQDQKGATKTQAVQVYSGAIGEIKLNETKKTIYTKSGEGISNTATIHATIKGDKGNTNFNPKAYTVTSSNKNIVTAVAADAQDGGVNITVTAVGNMYGKANVVIASTDGSKKKATCAVTVSGGINKVEFHDAEDKKVTKMTLFRSGTNAVAPKQKELKLLVKGTTGANLKAYEVTSSNPKLVAVTLDQSNNKITLKTGSTSTGKATITLMATDGSKKKATCTVTVVNPASRINIAPKGGETGCVVPGKSLQLVATMETEHGAVSNKKVSWRFADADDEKNNNSLLEILGIKINESSGKITVPKEVKINGRKAKLNDLLKGIGANYLYLEVVATAKDGSGVQNTAVFWVAPGTTYIIPEARVAKMTDNAGRDTGIRRIYFTSDCFWDMTCSSSSPKVASPTIKYTPRQLVETEVKGQYIETGGTGYIEFVYNQAGTVNFTLKALDGSNQQKKTISIRVK